VVGCSDDERATRAARLARAFHVPHLRLGATPTVGDSPGYVIEGCPDTAEGMQALLALPADLVVHMRPYGGSDDDAELGRVLDYYEARGVLVAFPPVAEDEEIIIAIEAAVRGRTGTVAQLPL
jgi:hypothetical protein